MAGIGFRLQKLLSGDSYSDLIKAYLYSSIIATGPMLIVVLSLALVNTMVRTRLTLEEGAFFMAIIVYVYAFSILITGPFLYVVTRFLADKHYENQLSVYSPTYLSVLLIVFALQTVVGWAFISGLPLSLDTQWIVLCLYLFVSGIWIAMLFLSAAQSYLWIVFAFLGGGALGVAAAIWWGTAIGFDGFVKGYALGQAFTFIILSWRLLKEFGFEYVFDFQFLAYFKKFPHLVLVGLLYYAGVWIDKMIFWASPYAEAISGGIRLFADYDTPQFVAFLTIVPSMAFFLVQMETSFARYFRAYYQAIQKRNDLETIRYQKKLMVQNLTNSFLKYAVFQGILSGVVILFIYEIADSLYLNPLQIGVFRISILGAFLQMGFVMVLNILFYFDFQKDAFWLCFIYFLSNCLFTLISLKIGFEAFGFGYTAACFVSLLVGFYLLDHKLRWLNYWTFMQQPILIPKFKLESEK